MRRYRSLPELAEMMERAARHGRTVRLSYETAVVVVAALRAYSTHPTREAVIQALCTVRGGCGANPCYICTGRANGIMRLYKGAPDPTDDLTGHPPPTRRR